MTNVNTTSTKDPIYKARVHIWNLDEHNALHMDVFQHDGGQGVACRAATAELTNEEALEIASNLTMAVAHRVVRDTKIKEAKAAAMADMAAEASAWS